MVHEKTKVAVDRRHIDKEQQVHCGLCHSLKSTTPERPASGIALEVHGAEQCRKNCGKVLGKADVVDALYAAWHISVGLNCLDFVLVIIRIHVALSNACNRSTSI